MDFPFVTVAMAWLFYQLMSHAESKAPQGPAPARPLLTLKPRPCPFCGGESEYHWEPGPGGGHLLRCRKCRDVYSVNAGAQTRWSITTAGGTTELCSAFDEGQAREFIEKVLARAAPRATFEVRLGAAEETPYYWEYFTALRQMYEQDRLGPDAVKH